jgi:CTP:molybdopterin cytidylyltransferase MocA
MREIQTDRTHPGRCHNLPTIPAKYAACCPQGRPGELVIVGGVEASSTTDPGEWSMTAGLVLAAGGGSRMGTPKAVLAHPGGGTLLEHSISSLRGAGCSPVVVVVGAEADRASTFADTADLVVVADDWAQGQSASLRAGIEALQGTSAASVAVVLVDLPDVGADVVRRVVLAGGAPRASLARAAYDGIPGHPVVIGRDHWAGVIAVAQGDQGARDYLASHVHAMVECGDLATGRDVDTPADLNAVIHDAARPLGDVARTPMFRPDPT